MVTIQAFLLTICAHTPLAQLCDSLGPGLFQDHPTNEVQGGAPNQAMHPFSKQCGCPQGYGGVGSPHPCPSFLEMPHLFTEFGLTLSVWPFKNFEPVVNSEQFEDYY